MAVFPGFAIMILLLRFSFLGDALRDALDPHIKCYSES
jgi:ABC-type dipeptide/oligopeptide/nickel transport system permease subunit